MNYDVQICQVTRRPIAAVRTRATRNNLVDKIREILSENAIYTLLKDTGITRYGKNVILYWDEEDKGLLHTSEGLPIEVGVQMLVPFEGRGRVVQSATPGGTTATMVHTGPYDKLSDAHAAVREWCRANNRPISGPNWEVYGHWNDDPQKLETEVYYLLK